MAFNTNLINKIKEAALLPVRETDFTPCVNAIKQLSLIADNEKKSSRVQEEELFTLMEMTQNSIDSLISAIKYTPQIKINQPGIDLDTIPIQADVNVSNSIKEILNARNMEKPSSPEPDIAPNQMKVSSPSSKNENNKTIFSAFPGSFENDIEAS